MGVMGLTTFVGQHQSVLQGRRVQWKVGEKRRLVVDGNALMHALLIMIPRSDLSPRIEFIRLAVATLKMLVKVNSEVFIIFDGATPHAKMDTRIKREIQKLHRLARFFTDTAHKQLPHGVLATDQVDFGNEHKNQRGTGISSPLAVDWMLESCKLAGIDEQHTLFALAEADLVLASFALDLERQGTNVAILSNDSDFFIIPLDRQPVAEISLVQLATVNMDLDTQVVDVLEYPEPSTNLAKLLKVPPKILPLFAALCGNDYSTGNLFITDLISNPTTLDRFPHIANTLAKALEDDPEIVDLIKSLLQSADERGLFMGVPDGQELQDQLMSTLLELETSSRPFSLFISGRCASDERHNPFTNPCRWQQRRNLYSTQKRLVQCISPPLEEEAMGVFYAPIVFEDLDRANAWDISSVLRSWIYTCSAFGLSETPCQETCTCDVTELIDKPRHVLEYYRRGRRMGLETRECAQTDLEFAKWLGLQGKDLLSLSQDERLSIFVKISVCPFNVAPEHLQVLKQGFETNGLPLIQSVFSIFYLHHRLYEVSRERRVWLSNSYSAGLVTMMMVSLTTPMDSIQHTPPPLPPFNRREEVVHILAQFQCFLHVFGLLSESLGLSLGLSRLFDGYVGNAALHAILDVMNDKKRKKKQTQDELKRMALTAGLQAAKSSLPNLSTSPTLEDIQTTLRLTKSLRQFDNL